MAQTGCSNLRGGVVEFKKSGLLVSLFFLTTFLNLPLLSQHYLADFTVAKEEVLRKIPQTFIDKARRELVVAYQHTSHGTQVSRGVFGLQDYKTGDTTRFGISLSPAWDSLEFRDNALESYAPPGITGLDLSLDETAFIQTSRNYLDAPENATVNVIMWSWCDIAGHDVAGNYLPGMDSLISEYGPGGSKIGTGPGMRELPVYFIYMTGHANQNANTGALNPMEQADTINDYCTVNGQYCLDYYSIDTHDMDDNYWEDAGDNADSDSYGGNFYQDWEDSHTLGLDYFYSKETPGGIITQGAHNTQFITANRKAYALWWILARMVGWDGDTTVTPSCKLEFSPPNNWIGGEAEITATASYSDHMAAYVEFQYSTDTLSWSQLPGPDSAYGRDSISFDGWSLTFQTENTPVHGTINDSSVWVRARAVFDSGDTTDWDTSEAFGVDNTPPVFSLADQTSPCMPGTFTLLQEITDTHSGVWDDENHPLFYMDWNNSGLSDTLCSDSLDASWSGSNYRAVFTIADSLVGDTLFWRVRASDQVGNLAWSDAHMAGVVQAPDSTGPFYGNFVDDGDQYIGDYHFSVDILDTSGVAESADFPRLYYRFNVPSIDSVSNEAFVKLEPEGDSSYVATVDMGNEHVGDYIYWRVMAINMSIPADTTWSAVQNGGRILNSPPWDIYLDGDSIYENSEPGTIIGKLFSADDNPDDTHTYELIPGTGDMDNSSFQLNQEGELLSAAIFDYEARDSCSIRLLSLDSAGDSCEKVLTIHILNVNEAPNAHSLVISPVSPGPDADLSLSYIYSDPENQAESGTRIRWYKESIHQELLDDTLHISYQHTALGEEWYATVQVSDNFLTSPELYAAPVIIANSVVECGSCQDMSYTSPTGSISDNSCDEDYENDANCSKLIQPAGAEFVTLSFTAFDLEENWDYVRVYDGSSTSDPLLGEFTGSELPPVVTSGPVMLVHFVADVWTTAEGWSAVYSAGIYEPVCLDEVFTDPSGTITDNSFDMDYMELADCQKLIQPAGAEEITLNFTAFDLEQGNDFVRVYDGASISDPLLGEFTGTDLPGELISSGGSLLLHFISNDSITASGWSAEYSAAFPAPPCLNEVFTDPFGTITDNSLDEDYINLADCQKLIQPAGAEEITLNFTAFDLEQGNDFVRVYDGASTSDPLLGEFTGTDLPGELISSGGSLLLHFISNDSISASGWSAVYSSSAPACGPCQDMNYTSSSGTISDNSCDEDYENNADCSTLIQPSGGGAVTLSFTSFNLEANWDYVRVYDGSSTSAPLLGEFTGSELPPVVTSGPVMLVHFTSDGGVTRSGWSAVYSTGTYEPECLNEVFTDPTGTITDNSFGMDYMNLADCQKLIQPAGAEEITLNFTDFDLEQGNDFVRVYDGASTSDPLLGEFTGNVLPGELISSGGSLLLHFISNDNITASGWSAGYSSSAPACGPCQDMNYTSPSGTISDNSCDEDYENNADCSTLIQPPGAGAVTLSFTSFNLEANWDYVRVYDGSSTSDPLLGEFTGTSLPAELISGPVMLVHFTSDGGVTRSGWSAVYSTGIYEPECLDELFTDPSGTITDNSFDMDYMDLADCQKLIQPAGAEEITLNFTAFDLEQGNDFVRVYDGASTSDPLLGEFSGTDLPGELISSGGSLLLHFISNDNITASGWSAEYSAVFPAPPCLNEVFTDPFGTITDNSLDEDYINQADCQKLIQPAGAEEITLNFTAFDLETGNDFVRVYDGASTSDPLLGEFSGTDLPGELISSGGSLLLHFISNDSIAASGWSADYSSSAPACGPCQDMSYTSSSGTISDNSCDEDYENNADCSTLIQPPGAGAVTLSFTSFNLETNWDYVRVYDGSSTSDPLLGEYTGSELPAVVTSGPVMLVHFTSDGGVTRSGWSAVYSTGIYEPECLDEVFTDPTGTITDNSFGMVYMNLADCQKLIQPAGAEEITLNFMDFDLEQGNDFVRVYDGASTSDPLLGEFTGTDLPGELISSGGSLLLHFISNDNITASGWSAVYASNAPACGPCQDMIHTSVLGTISDNSCDEDYENSADCSMLIQPPGAEIVTLRFTEFDVENNFDFVRVYDGSSTSDPLLGEFTGSELPPEVTSGPVMLVHFVSDIWLTMPGWSASYESGPDRQQVKSAPILPDPEEDFVLFPNPTDGRFFITLENEEEMDLVLLITDSSGKILVQTKIESDGNKLYKEVDFSASPPGIYVIQLYNTNFRRSGKVVVY